MPHFWPPGDNVVIWKNDFPWFLRGHERAFVIIRDALMDTEFPRRPTTFLSPGGRSDCPPWDLRYTDYMHIWVKDCGCKIVVYEVHQHQSSFKKWESLRAQLPVCLHVQSRSLALDMKLGILCYFFQKLTFTINSRKLKHWKHLTHFVTEKTGAILQASKDWIALENL